MSRGRGSSRRVRAWGRALLRALSVPMSQPLFDRVAWWALRAMNYGAANAPEDSGEAHVLRLVRRRGAAGQRPVVLDVGANTGRYARLAARLLPGVDLHCFEPSPRAYEDLARTCEALGAHAYPFALGARAEEDVPLHAEAPGSVLGSLHRPPGGGPTPSERVRVRTLDEACPVQGGIDLLKIDVEGHELAVLDGARELLASGRIGAVQFEFGEAHLDARVFLGDFVRRLTPTYRIYRVLGRGLAPLRYAPRREVFLTSNYLALRALPGAPPRPGAGGSAQGGAQPLGGERVTDSAPS